MKKRKNLIKILAPFAMMITVTSCSGTDSVMPDISEMNTEKIITDTGVPESAADEKETENEISQEDISTSESGISENSISENTDEITDVPLQKNELYEDNIWATFLVSPFLSAYETKEQGDEILEVLSSDSIIGNTASLSAAADPPPDITAYGTEVITAGGPVDYSMLAYGRLSEVPDSFLNAMTYAMKADIGDSYGGHSSGAGMGYRTFYQASYDSSTGLLQANQINGYWARTLGAFSEHCAGVAVDFDISYQNSDFLEYSGSQNREGESMASNEFRWLADNAYKYGFIWRYKIDGSDESAGGNFTGTIREGWHWRFVGVYHASKFWGKCASDTDNDGIPDTGYMTNDDYVWEDYFYENISGNSRYPQSEYEAFTEFYNTEKGNKCTYAEYSSVSD